MIQRIVLYFGISLFILSNSLNAQLQSIEASLSSNAEVAVESCQDTLILRLSSRVLEDTAFFQTILPGTALRNEDYIIDLPDTILFLSGEIEKRYPMTFIDDGISEGVESLIFGLRNLDTREDFAFPFTIHDEIPLEIAAPFTDTACIRNTIVLNGSGAGNYTWYRNNGDTISRQAQINYFPEDRDTVFLRGSIHDCFKDTFIVFDFFPDRLSLSVEDTVFICKGDSAMVTANSSLGNITWRSDIEGIVNPRIGSNVTIKTDTSSYVYVRFEGQNCVIQDTFFVRVDSLPPFTLDNVPLPDPNCNKYCKGDTFSIIANTANPTMYPDATFSWVPMDNSIILGDRDQDIIVVAQDSNYYIRTTRNNACEVEDSLFIEVIDPVMELSLNDTTVCANKPVSVEILNPELYTDIEWMPERGLSCTDCPNPTITTENTQTYTVTATKEGCCPSSAMITVQIDIKPIPIAPVVTCPNEAVMINVNDDIFTDPSWIGNTNGLSCTDCFNPNATVNQAQEYILQAFDTAGCLSQGVAVVTLYPDLDDIIITAEPSTEIGIGGAVNLNVETRPEIADTNGITYSLNGEPVNSTGNNVNILILEEGENLITASLIDDNGCLRTANIIITGVAPDVDVPNAFTPNGDDRNDIFRPVITNADNIQGFIREFRIFSRWGQLVYERTDANDPGWDGLFNGQPAPPEVYLYYLELTYPNGDVEVLKGDVTLIR